MTAIGTEFLEYTAGILRETGVGASEDDEDELDKDILRFWAGRAGAGAGAKRWAGAGDGGAGGTEV